MCNFSNNIILNHLRVLRTKGFSNSISNDEMSRIEFLPLFLAQTWATFTLDAWNDCWLYERLNEKTHFSTIPSLMIRPIKKLMLIPVFIGFS